MNGIGLSPAFRAKQSAFGNLAPVAGGEKRPSFTRTTDPTTLETRGQLSDFHTVGAAQFRFSGVAMYRSQMESQKKNAPSIASSGPQGTPDEELDRVMIAFLLAWSRLRGRMQDPEAMRELLASLSGQEVDQPFVSTTSNLGDASTQGFAQARDLAETMMRDGQTQSRSEIPQGTTDMPANPGNGNAGQSLRSEMQVFNSIALEIRETFIRDAGTVVGSNNDGLTVVDAKTIDTDRYRINFEIADTVRITDKLSGQYTRVWGDPHVDVSTMEGVLNGEFSDLKNSEDVTTFKLQDGTTIRFDAHDRGLIEGIDVMRGDTRIHGTGIDKQLGQIGIFHAFGSPGDIGGSEGDVVHAGNDGASWYDASGKAIWGREASTPSKSRAVA